MPEVAPPDDFMCPITHEIMSDPVVTADGQVYERSAIDQWLKNRNTSPVTGLELPNKTLTPVTLVKRQIRGFFENNHICEVRYFLEVVAQGDLTTLQNLNFLRSHLDACDESGKNALHLAAMGGHAETVSYLLKTVRLDINSRDSNRSTALHLAARHGHCEVVHILLAAGANVDVRSCDNLTPLFEACNGGHENVVKILLEAGADPDARQSHGGTPLFAAATKNHVGVLRLLLSFSSNNSTTSCTRRNNWNTNDIDNMSNEVVVSSRVSTRNSTDSTALHIAAFYGCLGSVMVLLEAGAAVDVQNKYGCTPLHYAARNGYIEIAKLLLEGGASIDVHCELGKTPLHSAASKGRAEMVKLLLSYNASLVARAAGNRTALHLAACEGQEQVVKLLLERGADSKAVDKHGKTAAQLAIDANHRQIADLISAFHQKIKHGVWSTVMELKENVNQMKIIIEKQQQEIKRQQQQIDVLWEHLKSSHKRENFDFLVEDIPSPLSKRLKKLK